MHNFEFQDNISVTATAASQMAAKIAIIQQTVGEEHPELAEELIKDLLHSFNISEVDDYMSIGLIAEGMGIETTFYTELKLANFVKNTCEEYCTERLGELGGVVYKEWYALKDNPVVKEAIYSYFDLY